MAAHHPIFSRCYLTAAWHTGLRGRVLVTQVGGWVGEGCHRGTGGTDMRVDMHNNP